MTTGTGPLTTDLWKCPNCEKLRHDLKNNQTVIVMLQSLIDINDELITDLKNTVESLRGELLEAMETIADQDSMLNYWENSNDSRAR